MSMSVIAIVAGVIAALNLITWATYRVDKARAGRGDRRIRERTLLVLAAIGGSLGALLAVYAHRHRHKARKAGFMVPLWLIVVAQIAVITVAVMHYVA
jgi:uncharacterized membrane protein YsdA (DUF1294 family)